MSHRTVAQDRLARVIPSMHVHLCVALWLISLHPSPSSTSFRRSPSGPSRCSPQSSTRGPGPTPCATSAWGPWPLLTTRHPSHVHDGGVQIIRGHDPWPRTKGVCSEQAPHAVSSSARSTSGRAGHVLHNGKPVDFQKFWHGFFACTGRLCFCGTTRESGSIRKTQLWNRAGVSPVGCEHIVDAGRRALPPVIVGDQSLPTREQGIRVLGTLRGSARFSSQCRYVRRRLVGCAVQVVRGQDRVGLLTVGTLRRYHQSGLGYVLHTGIGQYRSGRTAIACGVVRGRWWTTSDCVADGRDASAVPSVFGVHQELGWALCAVKFHTCLRGASGVGLLTFGQQLVWNRLGEVWVQTGGTCYISRT